MLCFVFSQYHCLCFFEAVSVIPFFKFSQLSQCPVPAVVLKLCPEPRRCTPPPSCSTFFFGGGGGSAGYPWVLARETVLALPQEQKCHSYYCSCNKRQIGAYNWRHWGRMVQPDSIISLRQKREASTEYKPSCPSKSFLAVLYRSRIHEHIISLSF